MYAMAHRDHECQIGHQIRCGIRRMLPGPRRFANRSSEKQATLQLKNGHLSVSVVRTIYMYSLVSWHKQAPCRATRRCNNIKQQVFQRIFFFFFYSSVFYRKTSEFDLTLKQRINWKRLYRFNRYIPRRRNTGLSSTVALKNSVQSY